MLLVALRDARFRSHADNQRAVKFACDAGWLRASRSREARSLSPLVRPAPCDCATSPTAAVYAPAQ